MQKERRQVGHDNNSRGQLTGSAQGSSRSYSGISHWASSAASKYLAFPLSWPCVALSTTSLFAPSWGNNEYRCSQAAYHQLGYSMEAVMRFIHGKIHSIREKLSRDPHTLHQQDVELSVAKLVESPLPNVFCVERSQHEALASNLGYYCLELDVNFGSFAAG